MMKNTSATDFERIGEHTLSQDVIHPFVEIESLDVLDHIMEIVQRAADAGMKWEIDYRGNVRGMHDGDQDRKVFSAIGAAYHRVAEMPPCPIGEDIKKVVGESDTSLLTAMGIIMWASDLPFDKRVGGNWASVWDATRHILEEKLITQ